MIGLEEIEEKGKKGKVKKIFFFFKAIRNKHEFIFHLNKSSFLPEYELVN